MQRALLPGKSHVFNVQINTGLRAKHTRIHCCCSPCDQHMGWSIYGIIHKNEKEKKMGKLVLSSALYNNSAKSEQKIQSRLWFQYEKPIPSPFWAPADSYVPHSKYIEY